MGVEVRVSLEVGKARTFAVALDWPGWCRAGKTETAAGAELLAAAPRYAAVVAGLGLRFPTHPEVTFVARLEGNASTEFGAPGVPPPGDDAAVEPAELARLGAILGACWAAFDRAAAAAEGKTLRTGPRGGGRALDGVRAHVAEADRSYVGKLGGRVAGGADHVAVRTALLDALAARSRGEVADTGPRGGRRWTARFGARYVAWHALDHAWELEDRSA